MEPNLIRPGEVAGWPKLVVTYPTDPERIAALLAARGHGSARIGKILGGTAKVGDPVFVIRHSDHKRVRAKITKIFEFTGLGTRETETAVAGEVVRLERRATATHVLVKKVRATPPRFPRQPGQAKRAPL